MRSVERKLALRELEQVVDGFFFFFGAFGEADEIRRFEMPRGCGQNAGTRDVVKRRGDEAQVGDDVFDERMIEDGEIGNDERNFAAGKFGNEFVAMRMLAIEHGKIPPLASRGVDAGEFRRDPGRFGFLVLEFGNADFLAFLASGAEGYLREVRADRVLRDDLCGDAENVRRGAIVFREGNAERCRVFAGLPARKTLEEELKAAEGGAAKTVDGLVVVADGENVLAITGEEFEKAELGDVRILKFVDEDVAEFVLQRRSNGRIFFEQVDRASNQGTERDTLLFAKKFFAGAIGTGDFELLLDFFESFFIGVVIERRAFAFELRRQAFGVVLVVLPGDEFILATGK